MALPYMPLYVADYLGDTMHLTLEQHGAYLKLLMCLWRSEGELPNDRLKIARMVGVSPAKWDKIGAEVMAFFEQNAAYFWSPRLTDELQKAEEYLAQKRDASAAAHNAKRLRNNKPPLPHGVPTTVNTTTKDLFEDKNPPIISDPTASVPAVCAIIWDETPLVCRRRSSISQLTKALIAAVHRRKNLAVIRQAVAAYYADPEKAKEDHRYARGVHRVVQDDYWESWAQAEGVHQIGTPDPEFQKRVWRTWMEDFMRNPMCQWDEQRRGPRPNEPGCRIAPEIMAEFGYTPPQRRAQ